jgi:hypothetical protein
MITDALAQLDQKLALALQSTIGNDTSYRGRNLFWQKIYEVVLRYIFLQSLNIPKTVLDDRKAFFYQREVSQTSNNYLQEMVNQSNFWGTMEDRFRHDQNQLICLKLSVWGEIFRDEEANSKMPHELKQKFTSSNFPEIWTEIEEYFKQKFRDDRMKLKNILYASLSKIFNTQIEKESVENKARMYQELSLPTTRGHHLSCMIIKDPQQLYTPAENQKWLVYFCPNAMGYEQLLFELKSISAHLGRHLIVMNYRGVGEKDVFPEVDDLEHDGKVVVEHLINLGVQTQNITAFGNSLGGSVAINVAKNYQKSGQEMSVVADKTFTNYLAAAVELFRDRFNGIGNLIVKIITFVIEQLGWNLDSWSAYQKIKGPKYLIDHPNDGLIRERARLGNMALGDWERECKMNSRLEKPVVIEDEGHEKIPENTGIVTQIMPQLMTEEGYGSHTVSCLRTDPNGQVQFSKAYQELFRHMNAL